jgi:hypothetical protein
MRTPQRALTLAAAGSVAALALGGCAVIGAGATPAPSVTPAPTGTVPSAIPVKNITVAIPKPKTAPPTLATSGGAWPKVLASLSAYGQWLLTNPDPALAGNVTAPGCAVANRLGEQLTSLINERAYVLTAPPVFTSVTGPTPAPSSGDAVLYVTASRPAEQVMSQTSKNVAITSWDTLPQTTLEVTLKKGVDGKWRYCTIERTPDETDPAIPLL